MLDKCILYTRPHGGAEWVFHCVCLSQQEVIQRAKSILSDQACTQIGYLDYKTGNDIPRNLSYDTELRPIQTKTKDLIFLAISS